MMGGSGVTHDLKRRGKEWEREVDGMSGVELERAYRRAVRGMGR